MGSVKHYWLDLPLGRKIAALTSLLVVIAILALTYLSIQRERGNFRQELESQAGLLLETLPLTMRDQLYRMELDELVDIAGVVSNNQNITMIVVYDERGAVLVDSTQSGLRFSQEVDPLGGVLIALERDRVYMDWQEDQLVAGRAILLGNQPTGAVAIGLSTQPLDQKVAALTQQSLLLALIMLAIGIGLTILFARYITNPLRDLTRVSSQMTGGDLSVRLELESEDEIGQLGAAFDQMADAIQKRDAELRELAFGLERTVDDRTNELRLQNQKLEQIAISDPLTKCYNRRYFFELAAKEIERLKRYGHPLAVVIIDVDRFKVINDTYGHQVGDQVLINLVDLFQENIRGVDIFARYGGEEFVILMPETACVAADVTARRLRRMVAEEPVLDGDPPVSITISLGVACWGGEGALDLDALLAQADQALYQSKEAGRNRVSVWGET